MITGNRRSLQVVLLIFIFNQLVVSEKETTVSLDFVGDIHLGGPVLYQNKHGYCSYNETFEHVAKYLRQSDLAIGNLEAAFIRNDMDKDEQMEFRPRIKARADSAESLKYAGFDIMGLANNHLNDFKIKPINYTVDILSNLGIKSFGYTFGTLKENKAQVPLIVEVKGIKIGFLGYCDLFRILNPRRFYYTCKMRRGDLTAGPAMYSDETATRDVKALKDKVDVVVVALHWGDELHTSLSESQLQHYLHLKSLGVHLIIGSHPHVLQVHTLDQNTFAAFSLGNFVFGPTKRGLQLVGKFYYDRDPPTKVFSEYMDYVNRSTDNLTLKSRILRVHINRNGFVKAQYLPLRIGFDPLSSLPKCYQPQPIQPPRWIDVCSKEDKECAKFSTGRPHK